MARIRTIKPGFFTSLTIADLTLSQRLLFIGLWTHVDDEGRCVYDPRLLKAAIWPLDEVSPAEIQSDTGALQEASLITVYEASGRSYLAVNGWAEHQKISHPSKSTLPPPDFGEITPLTSTLEDSRKPPVAIPEEDRSVTGGNGMERKGREAGTGAHAPIIREDVERLCKGLADLMEGNGSLRPTISEGWRNSARLLLDKDKRPIEQAIAVLAWSQRDEFWKLNVHSMPTFREKYDKLRLKWQKETNGGASYGSRPGERKFYA